MATSLIENIYSRRKGLAMITMPNEEWVTQEQNMDLILLLIAFLTIFYPFFVLLIDANLASESTGELAYDDYQLIGYVGLGLSLSVLLLNQLVLLPKSKEEREKNPGYVLIPMMLAESISLYGLLYGILGVLFARSIDWFIAGVLFVFGTSYSFYTYLQTRSHVAV